MASKTDNQTLGFTFLVVGVGLTISMATTLGVAFLGIGLPFVVLGILFLSRAKTNGDAE